MGSVARYSSAVTMLLSGFLFIVFMSSSVMSKVARHHHLSHGCVEEQRSRPGDQLAVHFQQLGENGALVNSTEGGEPFTFILGKGEALEGWDEGLRKVCAGEIVELVVASESAIKTYVITIEVITRTMKKSAQRNGKGILVRKEGKCRDAKVVKLGDTVTLQTVARIPNYLYLSYPHPTGNTPIRIKMRGIPGVKIDSSQDTIKTGEGHLVPGWEMGILGACEGETRMILIGPNMAFGDTGVYQLVPPKVTLALEVEVIKVDRDRVDTFLQQGAEGRLFTYSL